MQTTTPASRRATSDWVVTAPRTGAVALRTGALAWVAGTAVILLATLGLGLLLADVLDRSDLARWDRAASRLLARHRTPLLDDVTSFLSALADTVVVVTVAALVAVVRAVRRAWRDVVLLVSGLLCEVSVFLATTFLVDRPRPPVDRLDAAPPTSSFPSGHTAAACVLYLGLACIADPGSRRRVMRVVVWVGAAVVVAAVAFARLYRGMHYTTDVATGVALGLAALGLGVLVARRTVPGPPTPGAPSGRSRPSAAARGSR